RGARTRRFESPSGLVAESESSTCRRPRGPSLASSTSDGRVRDAKTSGSMATIPLSQAAVAIVKERRRTLMRRSFTAASSDAFVFTGRNGRPLTRRNALRAWQVATKDVLGNPLRLHDLRTTFASRLLLTVWMSPRRRHCFGTHGLRPHSRCTRVSRETPSHGSSGCENALDA
ncbi:MAG: phage integrase family protein, partial [Actinobacteria bacterium]